MTKNELVAAMAAKSQLTKADTERALSAFTETVTEALSDNDKVTMVGFGTFSVSSRAARMGRNPKTGEALQISASKTAKFKASKNLKGAL